MTEHTQGPWSYVETFDYRWKVKGPQTPSPSNGFVVNHEGDARLIAAAPDLFVMLERVLAAETDLAMTSHGRTVLMSEVGATIAKAKGKRG